MSTKSIHRPELVCPAGDLEKLETAVRFGADTVYVGGSNYSLRAAETGFTLEELKQGIRFAHEHGCKVYLALNIFAFDSDLDGMLSYFKKAQQYGIDAVIVSDPGILALLAQYNNNTKIHLSTQANTTNSAAVRFWLNQGISRIVLARELTLEQVKKIKEQVPEAELELFVHGAMCISYSGRCLLSKFFAGRSGNRGECAQPCRWGYELKEVLHSEPIVAQEDQHGTYLLNSKDLCLIEYIPELINAGITSFKIEGRMKSPYYVALVTRIYRQAIDTYCADPENYKFQPEWLQELANISHRPYTTGFYFAPHGEAEYFADSAYIKPYDFVGTVIDFDENKNLAKIAARNFFRSGDDLEIIDPHNPHINILKASQIKKENGEFTETVHNQFTVYLPSSFKISKNSLVRRKR